MKDWNKRYREAAEPPFGTQPSEYLRQILARSDVEIGSALLPADGDGRNGRWLAGRGIAVTAVDISDVATAQARIADGLAGCAAERIAADLDRWAPDPGRAWDAVFIIALHGPAGLRARLVRNAAGWLGPGGWLAIEGFSAAGVAGSGPGPKEADKLWDVATTLDWLEGVEMLEAFEGMALLDEGPRHQGASRMVRLLGRRRI